MVKQLTISILRAEDSWYFEGIARGKGFETIAGIDEAGRGPLAGPVVAAAVVLPWKVELHGIDDSKRLPKKKRLWLAKSVRAMALGVGVGISSVEEIERLNILKATFLAMKRAVNNLKMQPDCLLVDGLHTIPDVLVSQKAIVKGDQLSISISSASIIAKVERDCIMDGFHQQFPQYNFKANKGYGTAEHCQAIAKYGCCSIHRKTFRGVKEYI